MVKNINQALFDIKANEKLEGNQRTANEIREDIQKATRNARLLRQKIVNKSGHYHDEAMKPSYEEIMAKKPLIIRRQIRIPVYGHPLAGTVYDKAFMAAKKAKKVAPVTPVDKKKKHKYSKSSDSSEMVEVQPLPQPEVPTVANAMSPVDDIVSDLEEAREKEGQKRESMFELMEPQIQPEPFQPEPLLSPHAFPANLLDMSDSFRAGSSHDRDMSGEGAINL